MQAKIVIRIFVMVSINVNVRLHKSPLINIIYHNLTSHIIMSAVNREYYLRYDTKANNEHSSWL